jgi:uncharacterized Zn finger protein
MTSYQAEKREWWVQKWLDLLDSYPFKKRLERARIYAREGNVLKIEFKQAQVLAEVQGTEAEPYKITLSLDAFSNEDWNYVIETMAQKAIFSAQLLVGEMPENIEQVFTANGLSLFPFSLADIRSRCSCPDKANPCKHIGAVYYQLGDRFSEDPFVLFQLRGRTREQIQEALRYFRSTQFSDSKGNVDKIIKKRARPKTLKKSTPLTIEDFWRYDQSLDPSLVVITPPTDDKTVLDVLGNIPLPYNDAQSLLHYLKQVYNSVSQKAVILALKKD